MNELLLEKYAYKKKKPVLLPFVDNIKLLLEHDATQQSILEYLKNEEDITVSQPYLSKFIKQYIYGDKQKTSTKELNPKELIEETPKTNPIKKIDSSNTSDKTIKDENATTEMSKAERDATIEEWIKNNQNILIRPNKGE